MLLDNIRFEKILWHVFLGNEYALKYLIFIKNKCRFVTQKSFYRESENIYQCISSFKIRGRWHCKIRIHEVKQSSSILLSMVSLKS